VDFDKVPKYFKTSLNIFSAAFIVRFAQSERYTNVMKNLLAVRAVHFKFLYD